MSDVLPMARVFRECAALLDEARRPVHYRRLTELAVTRLGADGWVNMKRQIEDVREKMLQAGRLGTGYLPSPLCLGYKTHWFHRADPQRRLFQGVALPYSAESAHRGSEEWRLRQRHMNNRRDSYTPAGWARRVKSGRDGLIAEAHVSDYLRGEYPDFWWPPDNDGQYDRGCWHDFKLCVDGRAWAVDVTTKPGKPEHSTKQPTDLHLLCRPDGDGWCWYGVVPGSAFNEAARWTAYDPDSLLVWLNCRRDGLPYAEIRAAANP